MISVGSPSSLSNNNRNTSLADCEYSAKFTPAACTVAPSGYHFPAETVRTFIFSSTLAIVFIYSSGKYWNTRSTRHTRGEEHGALFLVSFVLLVFLFPFRFARQPQDCHFSFLVARFEFRISRDDLRIVSLCQARCAGIG